MRKLLTIDCWNTLIKPSGDKERIIYCISRQIGVPYAKLWEAVEYVKVETRQIQHMESNYIFWFRVRNRLNLSTSTPRLLKIATAAYDHYTPQVINLQVWNEVIRKAINNGYDVRILSNTGYIKSDWLEKYFGKTLGIATPIPVIGSDIVGAAKPELEFYRRALDCNYSPAEDRWIHIGDSVKLDMEPVTEMGGTAILFTGWDTFDDVDLDALFI